MIAEAIHPGDIAPCGIDCALCLCFRRAKNKCAGCKGSGDKPRHCTVCGIRTCPKKKGDEKSSCGVCVRFPCRRIRDLDRRYRTRYGVNLIGNLESISASGIDSFAAEEAGKWKCPACGSLLCMHSDRCLVCGSENARFPRSETPVRRVAKETPGTVGTRAPTDPTDTRDTRDPTDPTDPTDTRDPRDPTDLRAPRDGGGAGVGKGNRADNLRWLLDSDPALIYQTRRDLLHVPEKDLKADRDLIAESGWASELLKLRKSDGHWGNGAYNPKWTCTHYVLHELMQLGISEENAACRESCERLLAYPTGRDGGVNYAKTIEFSDVCVNGMLLAMASYFDAEKAPIRKIVDYLLRIRMKDGGWNCEYLRGATHGSLHTTMGVLEGFGMYLARGNGYREDDTRASMSTGIEFILRHRLYRSDHTGETIKDEFLKFPFPVRWKYDILRCMDFFARNGIAHDERMDGALDIIERARNANGRLKAQSQIGATYFVMEKNGEESRWNTLRATRVLERYGRIPAIGVGPT